MPKIQTYKNTAYCLSYQRDVVFLDIEVKITCENEANKVFSIEIVQMQLNKDEEALLVKIIEFMPTEALSKFYDFLKATLIVEMSDSLFSYFYSA